MKTAFELLEVKLNERLHHLSNYKIHIKEIETKEKLKHQLFIGKVSEVIGFEKTVELLKQVNEEIN